MCARPSLSLIQSQFWTHLGELEGDLAIDLCFKSPSIRIVEIVALEINSECPLQPVSEPKDPLGNVVVSQIDLKGAHLVLDRGGGTPTHYQVYQIRHSIPCMLVFACMAEFVYIKTPHYKVRLHNLTVVERTPLLALRRDANGGGIMGYERIA